MNTSLSGHNRPSLWFDAVCDVPFHFKALTDRCQVLERIFIYLLNRQCFCSAVIYSYAESIGTTSLFCYRTLSHGLQVAIDGAHAFSYVNFLLTSLHQHWCVELSISVILLNNLCIRILIVLNSSMSHLGDNCTSVSCRGFNTLSFTIFGPEKLIFFFKSKKLTMC